MPLLNLIHEQQTAIKREQKKARMFFTAFLVTAGVFGFVNAGIQVDILGTRSAISDTQHQIDRAKPMVKEIEANKKEFDELSPFVKALDEARDNTSRWNRFMIHLSKQSPDRLYLTQMKSAQPEATKPMTVTISGNALDNEAVGEFLLRIANSMDVDQARFNNTTSPKPVGTATLYGFEIAVDLAGTAHAELKKEGDPQPQPAK